MYHECLKLKVKYGHLQLFKKPLYMLIRLYKTLTQRTSNSAFIMKSITKQKKISYRNYGLKGCKYITH